MDAYQVKLPLFEGPFDLLLFFIERDELDVYDIPIAKVTDDFLSYIKQLESLDIEIAAEFIFVASSLMRIKAKMLIPRPEINELGEEVDPRAELVKQLLEYKKYKSVVSELAAMEQRRLQMYERGNAEQELESIANAHDAEFEMQSVDLYKLLKVFSKVMERFKTEQSRPVHTVVSYPYTIEGQKEFIRAQLIIYGQISFIDLMEKLNHRIEAIYSFLALLEMIQLGECSATLGDGFNNFWIASLTLPMN